MGVIFRKIGITILKSTSCDQATGVFTFTFPNTTGTMFSVPITSLFTLPETAVGPVVNGVTNAFLSYYRGYRSTSILGTPDTWNSNVYFANSISGNSGFPAGFIQTMNGNRLGDYYEKIDPAAPIPLYAGGSTFTLLFDPTDALSSDVIHTLGINVVTLPLTGITYGLLQVAYFKQVQTYPIN